MNGRVYGINRNRGMVAIETELHGFTIVELLNEADIEVGDEVSWESDTGVGSQTYSNVSKNRSMDVLVHNHLVSKSALRQQLLMG